MLFKDEKFNTFFQYFGLFIFSYTLLKNTYRLLNNLATFYLGYGSADLKKIGSWAVVTGCTDGIGKAYAEKLANLGLNLVLISRTEQKLKNQAKEIEEKFKVDTKIIAADFCEQNSIYSEIKQQLTGLDIGILVNNVGVSYPYPEFFDAFAKNEKAVSDMINCNITSVTKMTAIVLPTMIEKRKGLIINNASGSGRIPTPLLTVYSASKAYVDFFSRALNTEYKSKGIVVQSLCPYFVSTKLSALRRNFMTPTPAEFVSSALATVNSQPVTNGCLIHNLQGWLYEDVVPSALVDKMTFNMMLGVRAKAIRKAKKLEEQQKRD
ncbi:very-long-chain 3-oxoacyl- reductase [Brachionus plicatilis]|uniref:Very-long-chain 3-oxoacyl-reductase n=1 Tax=Brachionus plicatilis TaxID=10195 RepID=A0A3M7SUC4_BRAPC|nr:very-long-chain 3-oxoacyl- reductase [Brachionus plicatilis]